MYLKNWKITDLCRHAQSFHLTISTRIVSTRLQNFEFANSQHYLTAIQRYVYVNPLQIGKQRLHGKWLKMLELRDQSSVLFSICLPDLQQQLQLPKHSWFLQQGVEIKATSDLDKDQKKYKNLSLSWYSNIALILGVKSESKNTSNISQNCVSEVKFLME